MAPQNTQRLYHIVDLNYISLYIKDFQQAIAFYTQVFGEPESVDERKTTYGWKLGATWLTIFDASKAGLQDGNPSNTEFAVQVAASVEVDQLYQALIAAGAKPCMSPKDTAMYQPMRFCCVDDTFGVRIDVYYPLG